MNRCQNCYFLVLVFTCIIHGGVNYGFKETLNIIYLDNVNITGTAARKWKRRRRKWLWRVNGTRNET